MLLLLLTSSSLANAEVYKCILPDETVYQSTPCPSTAAQSMVEIKDISPERLEQAQQELKHLQKEMEVQRLADETAQKEREKAQREQAVIDALNRAEQRARDEENRARAVTNIPIIISPDFIRVPGFNPHPQPHPGVGQQPHLEPRNIEMPHPGRH
jgi:Skp family chaperone for outer membrane proteins